MWSSLNSPCELDVVFGTLVCDVTPDKAPVWPMDVAMATGRAIGGGGGGGSIAVGMNPAILVGLPVLPTVLLLAYGE